MWDYASLGLTLRRHPLAPALVAAVVGCWVVGAVDSVIVALALKILHNDMTVMVPCENAHRAGLRRVIAGEEVEKVISVLTGEVSDMP